MYKFYNFIYNTIFLHSFIYFYRTYLSGEIMKSKLIIACIFLMLLSVNSVSATSIESKNSEMPLYEEFDSWISGFTGESDFVESAYDGYIEEFPQGHVDKVQDTQGNIVGLVFYVSDPSEGDEGYDSYYYDMKGDKIGVGCNTNFKLVEPYKGEGSSDKTEVEDKEEKEISVDASEEKECKSCKVNKEVNEEEDEEETEEEDNEESEIEVIHKDKSKSHFEIPEDEPESMSKEEVAENIAYFYGKGMSEEAFEECVNHYLDLMECE